MKIRKYTVVLMALLLFSVGTLALARTAVQIDDLGFITGPAGFARYTTLNALVTDVAATPTIVIVNTVLTADTVTVPRTLQLSYRGSGAISVNAGQTVTFNSAEQNIANPRQEIYTGLGAYVWTIGGVFHPGHFGAIADGIIATGTVTTDNSGPINEAFAAAYLYGGMVQLQSGIYGIRTTVGVTVNDATARRAFPTLHGVQASQVQPNEADAQQLGTILMLNDTAGATAALGILQTNLAGYFEGGEIRNLKIIRVNNAGPQDQPIDSVNSIGINIRHWIDHRMYNVVVQGFYFGIFNFYGYSSDWFGVSTTRNNYGIWLDEHSNAISLNGIQAHQNNVGVRINAGTSIQLNRITAEGQDFGVVISNNNAALAGPYNVSIDGFHAENNTTGDILVGVDELGATSTNTVGKVFLKNIHSSGNLNIIELDDVNEITIYDTPSGQVSPISSTTNNTVDLQVLGHPGLEPNYWSSELAVDQRVGIRHPYNLITNGWTNFPSLQYLGLALGATVDWFDDAADSGRTVTRITVPNGLTNALVVYAYVNLDERMMSQGATGSIRMKRSAVDVACTVTAYSAAGAGLAGSGMGPAINTWDTFTGSFLIPAAGNFFYFAFVVTNNSGGDRYIYFENFISTMRGTGQIVQSPLDVLVGLSGNTETDAAGDATVTLSARYYSARYHVLATVNENTWANVRITRANGSFAIKTTDAAGANEPNVVVAWLVIPRSGVYAGY